MAKKCEYISEFSLLHTASSQYRYADKHNQDVREYLLECMDKFKGEASPRRIKSKFCHYPVSVKLVTCPFVKVSHFSTAPSQDGTSFGCVYCCHMCLSRCHTFRQHPVKMAHLSAGSFVCIVVSHVFVKVSHLSAAPSQDGTSFGWLISVYCCVTCLSRCHTFRQHPVKMAHLSAGSFVCIVVSRVRQGVAPFGSTQSRWHIFRLVHLYCYVTCVSHLLAASTWCTFQLIFCSNVCATVNHIAAHV